MVTTFYPPANFGGDGLQVQRIVRALAKRGHEVTVVHAVDAYRTLSTEPVNETADEPGVTVVPIETRAGALAPLATHLTGRPLLSRRPLAKALHGPFDVLHFHNASLIGGPAVLGMGQAAVRVYTAHEQWLVCPTHVLWKSNREVCEKPTCIRCSLSYRRPPQLWRSGNLLDKGMTELDALIVPSGTSARLHERFAGTVRIEQIPHFVPDPHPTPPLVHRRPYFLFVGRHERIKGLDRLIEAFRRRSSEDLLIAGDGPERASLERSAAGLSNVRFLGWQSPAALDALYRGALAVVVPTRGHESFGLVAVEAFARSTPAIVHDFGALAELAHEAGGVTFRTDHELDAALDRIASSPQLREELGQRGRQAYEQSWTVDAHLNRYLGLVAELASRRGHDELAAAAGDATADQDARSVTGTRAV